MYDTQIRPLLRTLRHLNFRLKLQKAAIRIVFSSKYNDHTEPIVKALAILPLEERIFFYLQHMQRFKQGFLPIFSMILGRLIICTESMTLKSI